MWTGRSVRQFLRAFPFVGSTNLRYVCEVIGWLLIIPYLYLTYPVTLGKSADTFCMAPLSRNESPDGSLAAVVLSCCVTPIFGGSDCGTALHLVHPKEEENLLATADICDNAQTLALSTWTDDLKGRPLLHWREGNRLEATVAEGTRVILLRTRYDGATVDVAFEDTAEQKQRRKVENARELANLEDKINNAKWTCR